MIDPISLTALIAMIAPLVVDWISLTIRDADKLYKDSQEFKNKVDSMAEKVAREYENKWSTTTPSTRPTVESFVKSKMNAYKDEVLALQRKAEDLNNRIQARKDNPHLSTEGNLRDEYAQLDSAFSKLDENKDKLFKGLTAVTQGAKYKFTNAEKVKNWAKKGSQ